MDNKDPYDIDGPDDDPYDRSPDRDEYAPVDPSDEPGELDEHEPAGDDAFAYQTPQPQPVQRYDPTPQYAQVACIYCGYNLTGIAIGGTCPECGADVDASLMSGNQPTNGMAVTSMVLGIVSLCGLLCCFGGLLGILGLIFGIIAMNQVKNNSYASGSKGMALAGIICSSIALFLSAAFLFLAAL